MKDETKQEQQPEDNGFVLLEPAADEPHLRPRTFSDPGVYKKIAAVMTDLTQLDATYAPELRFWYLSEEKLLGALRPLMGKHGLVLEFLPQGFDERTQKREKSGTVYENRLLVFSARCRLIDVETGHGSIPSEFSVEAYDNSDKTRESLFTKAKKAFLIAQFLVSAEAPEGEDKRPSQPRRPQRDDRQQQPQSLKERIIKATKNIVDSGTSWGRLSEIAAEFGFTGKKFKDAPEDVQLKVLAKLGVEV